MHYFELIAHQSLILFVSYYLAQCEELEYALELDLVQIENRPEKWESLLLCKYKEPQRFAFKNAELNRLCGGEFTSYDVEIVEVFNRAMRFSLMRKTNESNDQLFINVVFTKKDSVEEFFGDVRSNPRQIEERGDEVILEKLFQYQVMQTENIKEPLQLLAHHVAYFPKTLCADWFPDAQSTNFTRRGFDPRHPGVLLVLSPKTFNISQEIAFKYFYTFIKGDLNNEIPCPHKWVTKGLIKKVSASLYYKPGSSQHPVKPETEHPVEPETDREAVDQ